MDEKLQLRAEQLAEEFAGSATTIEEVNQLMRLMMKSSLEKMLNTELDVHLGRKGDADSPAAEEAKRSGNRRNGRSKKAVQGELGRSDAQHASRPQRHVRAADHRKNTSDAFRILTKRSLLFTPKG